MPDDVLSPWPHIGPILYQLPHLIDIVVGDCLWDGEVHSDEFRDSQLVQLQVGVWGDDCPGREVYPLSHQVASKPPFLASKAGSDGFQRLPRLVLLGRLPLDLIVHQGCHVVLKVRPELIQLGRVCSLINRILQQIVELDNLLVGIGEVIFTAHGAGHCHRRSDRGWSYRQILDDTVLRLCVGRVKSHHDQIQVRDLLQDLEGLVRSQLLLLVL
mmetsp:Transcript_19470/g.18589  ORF Transcript_19470/g.18589 Transcript_19470/m.18589 type:complete len:214 (+) Transcript_19470:4045-4686(+)